MIDINELRRKFAVADSEFLSILTVTDEGGATFGTVYDDADTKFIAAANPAAISELLDRLEAVEKEVAHIKEVEFHRKMRAVAVGWEKKCARLEQERDALRAKVEAMERQEPVAFGLYSGWALKAMYLKEHEACEQRDRRQLTADLGGSLDAYRVVPLYALPGAQNVPTALLVAVANLVAQMEIVSRVGFVDTPNDKDSCAAFCVAEGTWLELMSCVESLAASLAAAPEAKP